MNKIDEDSKEKMFERRWLKNFEMERNCQLRWKYGITLNDYKKMLSDQSNSCAICGNALAGSRGHNNTFAVDHNHKTNKVRGLLCQSCNTIVVPAVEYYATRIKAAFRYLRKNQEALS